MALGFGFNKAKVLGAAEKFVQQGKFTNAITEYEKIIRHDPKDLTVLNTVGDLHARLGRTEQAVECFRRVGEAYAGDGFTVKAIAMFKKVTKLSPGSPDCMQKLADLYIQQGLYNDARSQFVHLAEHYLRAGDNEQASKIFQKMLDMDPDNSAMQAKLADLYVKMGRTDDARSIFFNAAESQLKRNAPEAADQALERVLKIDPNHAPSLAMRGKISSDLGRHEAAIELLEKLPNLDSQPDALRAMLKSRIATKNLPEATPVAIKLLTVHNDLTGVAACADAMMSAGEFEAALRLYDQYADRLLAADAAGMLDALHSCVHRLRNNISALEMLRGIYQKAGDSSHVNEVLEALAEAQVQAGELAVARDLYHQLAEAEPENPLHVQNYRQILARLGEGEESNLHPVSSEPGEQTFMVDELEISAPALEPGYPIEIAELVKSAMTDSELLDSYNLPSKAIKPLESVLPKAPQDPMLNQRLASLYARAERYSEAAKCCDTLRTIYWKAGYSEPALRYQEMAAKYRERAGEAPEPQAEAAAQPETAALSESALSAAETSDISAASAEMDLSHEWDSMASPSKDAAPPEEEQGTSQFINGERALAGHLSAIGDLLEEIQFYISQGMYAQAQAGIQKCATLAPDLPELADLRQQLQAVPAAQADINSSLEDHSDLDVAFDVELESAPLAAPEAAEPSQEPVAHASDIAPEEPSVAPAVAPDFAGVPAFRAAEATNYPPDSSLNDLVLDLEESLGADFDFGGSQSPTASSSVAPPEPELAPVNPVSAASSESPVEPVTAASEKTPTPGNHRQIEPASVSALSEVFESFKEEMEQETANESDDPESHYSLGMAFREMGLLDEAIGELQKVCHSIDLGHDFGKTIETYTWLAQCLVEKGVPQAAIKWYMRALQVPDINPDASLAVHYEMGMAYEAAGNTTAALDHYMEVYGTNIDYREVSERIKSLQAVVKST
jgi:pilus assembly protein FimV